MSGFSPAVLRTEPPAEIRICTVDVCDKPLRARGYCSTHWARWRRNGAPDLLPTYEQCTVDGCTRRLRSARSPHCETHYYRLRRTGTTADPKRISGQCLADGCSAAAERSGKGLARSDEGYCRMHYVRIQTRGDVEFDGKGEDHPRWTGENATYEALHQRVKKIRGVPSRHLCVDCRGRAQHWSYDHTDPDERFEPGKGPYSTDIDRYHPRCVSCHKKFDNAAKRSRK